ncbi:YkvA family protein [Falsiroseomonas sp.]|uniref:YkvA family protein n=1 Tax=Falsiroseomonas sp. TaxID=2870721 RepID=UPI0035614AB4
MLEAAKRWARGIRRDVHAVWLAARHPATPWYARALAIAVAAYALSPIDLIPDFVPVLGYLDDLVVVPLGILAVTKLVPAPVLAECRAAAEAAGRRPRSLAGAAAVVVLWAAGAALLLWWLWPGGAA